MYCPQCGENNSSQALFCASCGSKLKVNKKKKAGGINTYLPGVALIGSFCIAGYFYFGSDPKPAYTLDNQLSELQKQNLSKAYFDYTSYNFQSSIPYQDFCRFIDSHPTLIHHKDLHIHRCDIKGSVCQVYASLTSKTGGITPVEYTLVLEEGKWKILNMQLTSPGMNDQWITQKEQPTLIAQAEPINESLKMLKRQQSSQEEMNTPEKVTLLFFSKLKEGNTFKTYYGMTTESYRNTLSFEDFEKRFVKDPLIRSFKNIETVILKDPKEEGLVSVPVLLQNDNHEKSLYQLSIKKEANQWKIDKVDQKQNKLSSSEDQQENVEEKNIQDFDETLSASEQKKLLSFSNTFFQLIKDKNFGKAYYTHTSKSFRKATPFVDFRKFVSQHPILDHYQTLNIIEGDRSDDLIYFQIQLNDQDKNKDFELWVIDDEGEYKLYTLKAKEKQTTKEKDPKTSVNTLLKEHLNTLKKAQFEDAYQRFTSSEFQSTTSLQDFYSFFSDFPLFGDNQTLTTCSPFYDEEENKLFVKVVLSGNEKSLSAQYSFIQEDGKWKIWSIEQLVDNEKKDLSLIATEEDNSLKKALKKHLSILKKQDIRKAYFLGTSIDFRLSTSLDEYESFVQWYDFLSNHQSIAISKPEFADHKAFVRATITDFNDETKEVEFSFVEEEDDWKIFAMTIDPEKRVDTSVAQK